MKTHGKYYHNEYISEENEMHIHIKIAKMSCYGSSVNIGVQIILPLQFLLVIGYQIYECIITSFIYILFRKDSINTGKD